MPDDPLLVSLEGVAVPDYLSEGGKCPPAKNWRSVPIYPVWGSERLLLEKTTSLSEN